MERAPSDSHQEMRDGCEGEKNVRSALGKTALRVLRPIFLDLSTSFVGALTLFEILRFRRRLSHNQRNAQVNCV